jgi:hypothetical protein
LVKTATSQNGVGLQIYALMMGYACLLQKKEKSAMNGCPVSRGFIAMGRYARHIRMKERFVPMIVILEKFAVLTFFVKTGLVVKPHVKTGPREKFVG